MSSGTRHSGPLKFAVLGAGFWSRYQLAGWRELGGVECVAVYNRTRAKAERLASEFGVPAVYDDAREMLERERVDFVDIITDVDTHRSFVEMAAECGVAVICQKPMASTVGDAEAMVRACVAVGGRLWIHENWRWQRPIRELKRRLERGGVGRVFRARLDYVNRFPVFENQPFLKELEEFILTDVGSHLLDAARFLFGEPVSVYARTYRVHADIRGEDVATVVLGLVDGGTVTCNLSYGSRMEQERFPETYVTVEGTEGSVELGPDFWIRETTVEGTLSRRCVPPFYAWADPRYAVVHASIVDCNADLLAGLRGRGGGETTGADNLRTVRVVHAAYESARTGQCVPLKPQTAGGAA
jgi:D-apiose dehydrogenase